MWRKKLKALPPQKKTELAQTLTVGRRIIDYWITGKREPNREHEAGLVEYFDLGTKGTPEIPSPTKHKDIRIEQIGLLDNLIRFFPHLPRYLRAINEAASSPPPGGFFMPKNPFS